MPQFFHETIDDVLAFGESPQGRLQGAVGRFVAVTVGVSVALSAFLLPDYIGRYRAEEPADGLFLLSILGIAALAGFALALARILRRERWIVDAPGGALVLERAVGGGEPRSEVLDLSRVRAIEWRVVRWWRTSSVDAIMDDGASVNLVACSSFDTSLRAVAEAIASYAATHRVGVDVRQRS
jgi:hypothetical protein